jgi:hypothetical protein
MYPTHQHEQLANIKRCFVLNQHAELDFYSAGPLKQQSADRHVAQLGHIILIPSLTERHNLRKHVEAHKRKSLKDEAWNKNKAI